MARDDQSTSQFTREKSQKEFNEQVAGSKIIALKKIQQSNQKFEHPEFEKHESKTRSEFEGSNPQNQQPHDDMLFESCSSNGFDNENSMISSDSAYSSIYFSASSNFDESTRNQPIFSLRVPLLIVSNF